MRSSVARNGFIWERQTSMPHCSSAGIEKAVSILAYSVHYDLMHKNAPFDPV